MILQNGRSRSHLKEQWPFYVKPTFLVNEITSRFEGLQSQTKQIIRVVRPPVKPMKDSPNQLLEVPCETRQANLYLSCNLVTQNCFYRILQSLKIHKKRYLKALNNCVLKLKHLIFFPTKKLHKSEIITTIRKKKCSIIYTKKKKNHELECL